MAGVQDEIQAPISIPQATGDIVIDGVIDEAAWRDAVEFLITYEVHPGENTPAPVTRFFTTMSLIERVTPCRRNFSFPTRSIPARFSSLDTVMAPSATRTMI